MRLTPAPSRAIEAIVARFSRMLRSVGRRRGLADTDLDELEQEVRIRLWKATAGRETIGALNTSYVYRTAVSAALDMVRRRRSRREDALEPTRDSGSGLAVAADDDPAVEAERRELAEEIHRAVEALSEPRDVVVRLHLTGYQRLEIAELLGWTEPKVRNLLYRGLADLRALLEERGIGPGGWRERRGTAGTL